MRLTYDASVDAAYLYLVDRITAGAVHQTCPCEPDGVKGSINLDFDAAGQLLGMEVLGAKSVLPAEVLNKAELLTTQGVLRENR